MAVNPVVEAVLVEWVRVVSCRRAVVDVLVDSSLTISFSQRAVVFVAVVITVEVSSQSSKLDTNL
eukprot:gene2675-5567_t